MLPQAITTPKRVTTTWEREFRSAWPEAEIVMVDDYTDIARWMQRCAVSTAPAVIAITSQSLTAPGRITWTTAVQPVDHGLAEVLDVEAEGEAVIDAQGRTIAVKDTQGKLITKLEHQYRFFCPDCGHVIMDIGRGDAVVTAQIDVDIDVVERTPIPTAPATQEPVGQKASVTFGNLADIGKALRAARKARREDIEQQTESFQSPLFDL